MKEEMIEPMNKQVGINQNQIQIFQEINTIEITREIMIKKEIEAIEMIIDTETEKETGIEEIISDIPCILCIYKHYDSVQDILI